MVESIDREMTLGEAVQTAKDIARLSQRLGDNLTLGMARVEGKNHWYYLYHNSQQIYTTTPEGLTGRYHLLDDIKHHLVTRIVWE